MARLHAGATGRTLTEVLQAILLQQFTANIVAGRTVLSVSAGGTQTEFAALGEFTPGGIVDLANRALDWAATFPDPNNPNFAPQVARRLRVSFLKASI
jgi:hypothetical protein